MNNRPPNDGQAWTRDQLILAFELYCKIPFGKIHSRNPLIRDLAVLIGRTPGSVTRKLGNFGAFDPVLAAKGTVGLTNGSKLDRIVWEEFHQDLSSLIDRAEDIRLAARLEPTETNPLVLPTGPSERTVSTKQRIHQSFFRDAVLSSYENRCCVTGLAVPECLVAGHIIPWSVDEGRRADPTNGVCMSATFDRLFDCGLITIKEDLTLQVCKVLCENADEVVKETIATWHGKKINSPARFHPDPECLRWHNLHKFRAA